MAMTIKMKTETGSERERLLILSEAVKSISIYHHVDNWKPYLICIQIYKNLLYKRLLAFTENLHADTCMTKDVYKTVRHKNENNNARIGKTAVS